MHQCRSLFKNQLIHTFGDDLELRDSVTSAAGVSGSAHSPHRLRPQPRPRCGGCVEAMIHHEDDYFILKMNVFYLLTPQLEPHLCRFWTGAIKGGGGNTDWNWKFHC